VKPDLVKLAPADWLRVDRQWQPMLAGKRDAHRADTDGVLGSRITLATGCGPSVEQRRIAALARAVAALADSAAGRALGIEATRASAAGTLPRQVADRFGFRFGTAGYRVTGAAGRVRWTPVRADAQALAPVMHRHRGALRLLTALAMSLQEDLVLMERTAEATVRAALLHVSFPSAWDPVTKLGQDLVALHAPVAGNALVDKGPFVRWVWTVTADCRWRAWPPSSSGSRCEPGRGNADVASRPDLYFRVERQTTMPLGDGYGLFLIRVRPLDEVLAMGGRRELLEAALIFMSEEMIRYKNLREVRRLLLGR